MAGKKGRTGKCFTEADYLSALDVSKYTNYIDCSEVSLIGSGCSAEQKVIKSQCYHKLSQEAKEMIATVVHRPSVFILYARDTSPSYLKHRSYNNKLRVKYSNLVDESLNGCIEKRLTSKSVIKEFFKEKWKKKGREVRKVMEEITEFCEVLK